MWSAAVTSNEVGLGLGLAAITVLLIVLLYAIQRGRTTTTKVNVGELFRIEIQIGSEERAAAADALRRAAERRGDDTSTVAGEIDRMAVTHLARILWVDDNPDDNLYETIALERLGLFVTKATSSEGAEIYLQQLPIALIVTDLTRGLDRNAGKNLIVGVRSKHPDVPVIVYTTGADAKRDDLLLAGAAAVLDAPADLVAAVLSHRLQ